MPGTLHGLAISQHSPCEGCNNNIGSTTHKHCISCSVSSRGVRHTAADYAVLTQDTFRLGAAHIDETVACSESVETAHQRTQMVRSTVAGIDESMLFHGLLLEDALPSDEHNREEPNIDQRHPLQELLMVSFPSGHPCDELLLSSTKI